MQYIFLNEKPVELTVESLCVVPDDYHLELSLVTSESILAFDSDLLEETIESVLILFAAEDQSLLFGIEASKCTSTIKLSSLNKLQITRTYDITSPDWEILNDIRGENVLEWIENNLE